MMESNMVEFERIEKIHYEYHSADGLQEAYIHRRGNAWDWTAFMKRETGTIRRAGQGSAKDPELAMEGVREWLKNNV